MQKRPPPERKRNNARGLYIHIPFCSGKCFYCAFYSVPYDQDNARRYLRAIRSELQTLSPLDAQTIYFGGGTPSILSATELEDLCAAVRENIFTANLKEWTVEANPESLTAEKLAVLAKNGVNRISLGAQSFDNASLKWLGRRHDAAQIMEAVKLICAAEFDNFGLDLIACIPGINGPAREKAWEKTLQTAVGLKPKHISVYALTMEEGSRLANQLAPGDREPPLKVDTDLRAAFLNSHTRPPLRTNLLSEDEELAELDLAEKILSNKGFVRYEISNYTKPGCECLHNLSCWRGEEYLGLGPAASSCAGLERKTNLPDIEKYLDAVENGRPPPCAIDPADAKTRLLEKLIFGLRMSEGVREQDAIPWNLRLHELCGNGLLILAAGRWRLTDRGRNLADYVATELLSAPAIFPTSARF